MWLPWEIRSRIGVLPDFLIIGFPSCGTTSLYNYLISHPYIYGPSDKELWFFLHVFRKI